MAHSSIDWPSLLTDFRKTRGLKQQAAAADLGVSQATVSRWESGVSTPPVAVQNLLLKHARRVRSPLDTLCWADTFRRLLAPGIVIAADEEVHVVNNPLAARLGVPPSQVEGLPFDVAFEGEVLESRRRVIEEGVHAGRVVSYEGCVHARLNSQLARAVSFFVHFVGWPYFAEDGQIAAVEQGVFVSADEAAEVRARLGGPARFTLAA